MRLYVRTCANVRKCVNEGWSWATAILVVLGLGCLLVGLIFVGVLLATFLSVAYTLQRSR